MKRWIAALALGACVSQPDGPVRPCDVRATACQRDVFLAVTQLRNQAHEPWTAAPPVRVISPIQHNEEVAAEGRLRADFWSAALQALGLLTPGTDAAQASRGWRQNAVDAYYLERRITFIDRGLPFDDEAAVVRLAREYVHALQDREQTTPPYGRSIARAPLDWIRRAVIEGEAALFSELMRRRLRGQPVLNGEVEAALVERLAERRGDLARTRDRDAYVRYALPRSVGGVAFARAWAAHGIFGPDQLWTAPPTTALGFLAQLPNLAGPITCPAPMPPATLRFRVDETLGAFYFYAFLIDSLGEEEAWRLANAWRADRIWVFSGATARESAAVWRVRAPGFDGTFAEDPARAWSHRREGDDLVIVAAESPEVRQQLLAAAVCD